MTWGELKDWAAAHELSDDAVITWCADGDNEEVLRTWHLQQPEKPDLFLDFTAIQGDEK